MLDPIPELPDNTPISDVELPARIRNVLAAAGLKTVGEVREASDELLLSVDDIGKPSSFFAKRLACRRAMAFEPTPADQLPWKAHFLGNGRIPPRRY